MNIDVRCTCNGLDNMWDHDHDCDLWAVDDFMYGTLTWDPINETLVPSGYDTVNSTISFANEEDEEDAVVIREDTGDLVSIVLEEMNIQPTNEAWDEAVEKIGAEIVDIFDAIAYGEAVTVEDEAMLHEFGRSFFAEHANVLEPYVCICTEGSDNYCGECGVLKTDAGAWVPSHSRRKREIRMALEDEVYGCACAHKAGHFLCTKCGVQRVAVGAPWSYMDLSEYDDWGPVAQVKASGTSTAALTSTYFKCRHYGEEVTLPDGTTILVSSQHTRKATEPHPDFGCYLYDGWKPAWLAYHVNWRDYGLPYIPMEHVDAAARDVLERARGGQTVEIGCMGGHGRTGTFLAMLVVLTSDLDGEQAAQWVWDHYCKEAIEGDVQEWYIEAYHCWLNGMEIPEKPPEPCTWTVHKAMFEGREEHCDPPCSYYQRDMKSLENSAKSKTTPVFKSEFGLITCQFCTFTHSETYVCTARKNAEKDANKKSPEDAPKGIGGSMADVVHAFFG
jgi:hypothetical protein